ncbi:MAG: signal peptide peptidase SppA [Armatimonadota bacterium]|nr:signal peptide peptidase SppA [Armatimonadota bacterium]
MQTMMTILLLIQDLLRNLLVLLGNILVSILPKPDYVTIDLEGPFPQRRVRPRFPGQPVPLSLETLRERLSRVVADPRVKGVVVKVGDLPAGLATVESLRNAFREVREKGKRVVFYLPSADLRRYYLASVGDAVVMPESGDLSITGLRLEVSFYRRGLDRLGIEPQFDRIAEYKTAADPFLYPQMQRPHRENLESILDGLFEHMVTEIARSRNLDPGAVRQAINEAPLTPEEARADGLVDALLYEDELPTFLGTPEKPSRILPWRLARFRLRRRIVWRFRARGVIGVVQVLGIIAPGESRDLPLLGPVSGADTIIRALRAAERHPRVRAVVFYVNSRGGSALASDMIWREVSRLAKRKPVVAAMGDVAGSGGYYVACGAPYLIAHPATITGSIGVVVGKFFLGNFLERWGIHREILTRGAQATIESPFSPYSPKEWERLRKLMEEIYARFLSRVSEGRKKRKEEVIPIAGGRIWTGSQAHSLGLVDELGDFETAVARARGLAGFPPEAEVPVVTISPPRAVPIPTPARVLLDLEGAFQVLRSLGSETALALMPWDIWIG